MSSGKLDIDADTMKKEIIKRVPERFTDINIKAFELGGKYLCS